MNRDDLATKISSLATMPSRRGLLAVLGSLGLSVAVDAAAARNRRKSRRRKRRQRRRPALQRCGGLLGLPCSPGFACVDDPNDQCDPATGGADCAGICVARCGPALCPAGQVCCNESCGICTPPDGACILIACVP